MKNIAKKWFGLAALALGFAMTGCSDFEPTGLPEEVPSLAKVSNLTATVSGHDIDLTWTLPNASGIEGLVLTHNAAAASAIELPADATSYTIVGQPFEEEHLYTVKVKYDGGYVSEGVSVTAVLPHEDLADVTDLTASVSGRTVTLAWTLPAADGITGVTVVRGDNGEETRLAADATGCVLEKQPVDTKVTYTVKVVYDTHYASEGTSVEATIPYIQTKMAFLLLASSPADLPDDDERAAAAWFAAQENAELIQASQLAALDADIYPVLWIMVDRVGTPVGWKNLPSAITSDDAIDALKRYSANGGSLYLSNMATQLTVPLGFVPDNMAPTVYGNGDGGSGDDVWTINAYLGWDFRDGSDQGFYDRTSHAIFKDLEFADPNNYGYQSLPLIGPGQREDHNCLWDCNIYGKGNSADVIRNFEVTTNSLVLATWGHVRDHCVAGLVEFYSNADHGKCVANGFAAYEWNQNSGANPYQHNIEQLTSNILNYLK